MNTDVSTDTTDTQCATTAGMAQGEGWSPSCISKQLIYAVQKELKKKSYYTYTFSENYNLVRVGQG